MVLRRSILCGLTLLFVCVYRVHSHGYMILPPARQVAYLTGVSSVRNYDPASLNCGGVRTEDGINDGRCGACGDSIKSARPHEELNGKYLIGSNKVAAHSHYPKGGIINTEIRMTAYHKGKFLYRICALPNSNTKVTQECLDKTRLRDVATGEEWVNAEIMKPKNQIYQVSLQLPPGFTCKHCVLQWWYYTGNSYNCTSNGVCCVGCGGQETFVNCADISVGEGDSNNSPQAPQPNTPAPVTQAPKTQAPVTWAPWTPAPTTIARVTQAPYKPPKPKKKPKNKKKPKKKKRPKKKKPKKKKPKKKKPKTPKKGKAVWRSGNDGTSTCSPNGKGSLCSNTRLYKSCAPSNTRYGIVVTVSHCCSVCNHLPSSCHPNFCCCSP